MYLLLLLRSSLLRRHFLSSSLRGYLLRRLLLCGSREYGRVRGTLKLLDERIKLPMHLGELALERANARIAYWSLWLLGERALRSEAALLERARLAGIVTDEAVLAVHRLLAVRTEWHAAARTALVALRIEQLLRITVARIERATPGLGKRTAWAVRVVLLEIRHEYWLYLPPAIHKMMYLRLRCEMVGTNAG